MDTAVHRQLLGHGSERNDGKIGEAAHDQHHRGKQSHKLRLWVGTNPADGVTRFFCASEPAAAKRGITNQKFLPAFRRRLDRGASLPPGNLG